MDGFISQFIFYWMLGVFQGRLKMDGWMDGWMDGLMDGWIDGWIKGGMDE